ncbi:MAG TPA: ligase-associated DNA damage response DEXH box helicase, partial [Tepidisphaeraceae bacterium]|nr:ligase-associated DNA damage response DEXH box helicase [Tepidisphaeraceae bacterium]
AGVHTVIVDEWHELLGNKRGVQVQLALARLRHWNPRLVVWGLSATLGNLDEAMATLVGGAQGSLVRGRVDKALVIDTLLPRDPGRFSWGGHLGAQMLQPVLDEVEGSSTTLIFTNVRSQAEIWYQLLLEARPDWAGLIALHHGSLDKSVRDWVEAGLKAGHLKAVVATSSLDLGVDFLPVERVLQIGSAKGVARLLQRAGRSGHRPGEASVAVCVPTHSFELVEFSAARHGIELKLIESRPPLRKPLDVLVQHAVTIAAGGGFDGDALFDEVRSTHAFAELTREEWGWVLDFVARGGPTLTAYPRFARVVLDAASGRWSIASAQFARQHRLGIGTIVSDGMISLIQSNGRKLGSMEESFITRLKPGDKFIFAGRNLELISVHQMTARVRPAKTRSGVIAQWMGARFPMSTHLADRVRHRLDEARRRVFADAEMRRVAPLLAIQSRWSSIPSPDELLIESIATHEGGHHFLFPFLGRLVHEGLGAVVAHRIHLKHDVPVTATLTDYGIELHSPELITIDEAEWRRLLSPDELVETLLACLNAGELTKRQFREIARVAGLIVPNQPGQPRSNRQLQASSELFYEVFSEFDPANLLIEQARREVLEQQLEINRLKAALQQFAGQQLLLKSPPRLTPMAFPLWAQRISSQTVRVENASQRIERMLKRLEAAAVDDDDSSTSHD